LKILLGKHRIRIQNWLAALLLILALSIIGLGISRLAGSFIPFWLMFVFSVIYSIEKWLYYFTRKYKGIGKLYRLLLNLLIWSLMGLLVWSGIKLFSQQFVQSSVIGSLIFLAEFIFFVYIWRVVARNSWRWPSMKLTTFSLIGIFLVFSFAGVQPIANYKNQVVDSVTNIVSKLPERENQEATKAEETDQTIIVIEPPSIVTPEVFFPDPLPFSPEIAEDPSLRNPSWEELKTFLKEDKTDQLEYIFPSFVCADFATTLQSNAKKAGLRCAITSVELKGYPDWYNYGIPSNTGHALNAFETTDRGLVYIDCTGLPSGSHNSGSCDTIIDMKIGGEYLPKYVFPNSSDGYWESMGTIVEIGTNQW